jgi:hypothetical protein
MKPEVRARVVFGCVAALVTSFVSTSYAAGDLAVTKIKKIEVNGTDYFSVIVQGGGTGPCNADGTAVRFPKNLTSEADADRMFSTAMSAYLAGKSVRIHTYESGTDCAKAEYITIQD